MIKFGAKELNALVRDIGRRSLGYKHKPAKIPKSGKLDEPEIGKGGSMKVWTGLRKWIMEHSRGDVSEVAADFGAAALRESRAGA